MNSTLPTLPREHRSTHPSAPLSSTLPAASTSAPAPRRSTVLLFLGALWLIIFVAALFSPPLLDDADASHANAARHMALTGDLVTLHINGVRYLEKAPLPYWLTSASFRLFGFNAFAAHLPQAIGVLLLALLGFLWADRSFGPRTAFYTALATLTATGVFLFTRILIPEVLLSLFLATALYSLLRALEPAKREGAPAPGMQDNDDRNCHPERSEGPASRLSPTTHPYLLWTSLALAVLTKGLVALVFFFGTATLYLALTGEYKHWRRLKPFTGLLLFFAIAAPWHILAGLRNTGGPHGGFAGHGFFWFYFINEHVLRFLGKRIPMDYNKLPGYLFWSLHLVWLFPWALFLPLVVIGKNRGSSHHQSKLFELLLVASCISVIVTFFGKLTGGLLALIFCSSYLRQRSNSSAQPRVISKSFTSKESKTTLLLSLFSALVILFFSLSTNQEYYTFPAYLPLLLLTAAALTRAEQSFSADPSARRWITFAHAAYTLVGLSVAITLAYGLWSSRHLPFVADIGDLLAHRGVGDYTLSMSHLFDLTGPSFAALRLPAALAALALAFGPAIAWIFRQQRRHIAATTAIALTSAAFLVAAHIALIRFGPMLSSQDLAERIQELEDDHRIAPNTPVLLYGDQSYGSSIPFYLNRPVDGPAAQPVLLVDGRSSSMLFGSTFPDAPKIFLTPSDLLTIWGKGERHLLFVPLEKRDDVDHLLGNHKILLEETSGKALFTDQPLN